MVEYGKNRGVLYMTVLEKRRDGAVRGGWAVRTFLLTSHALHYYRALTENDLLGEERGRLLLQEITDCRAVSEDMIHPSTIEPGIEHFYLEITTTLRRILMRVPVNESSHCTSLAICINEQKAILEGKPPIFTLPAVEPTSPELERQVRFISAVGTPRYMSPTHEMTRPKEWIIRNKTVPWGSKIELGELCQGGACIITLNDGSYARIGTQALMTSWDGNKPLWVECNTGKLEIELRAECEFVETNEDTSLRIREPEKKTEPNVMLDKAELMGQCSFLLLCFVVHVFSGVDGFPLFHKACLTLGAAVAVLSLLEDRSKVKPEPVERNQEASEVAKLSYSIQVVGCRMMTLA